MPLFTIASGGADVPPDAYTVTLTGVEAAVIVPQTGKQAGQDVDVFRWDFIINDGEYQDIGLNCLSSVSSGPKSKMFAFLTALLGKAPETGDSFEAEDLIGKVAIATVEKDANGYAKLTALSAVPRTMRKTAAAPVAQPRGATPRAAAPVRTPVADPGADDELF